MIELPFVWVPVLQVKRDRGRGNSLTARRAQRYIPDVVWDP